jgi:hypothetical protein
MAKALLIGSLKLVVILPVVGFLHIAVRGRFVGFELLPMWKKTQIC